jgi:plastocyanin
MPNFIIVTSLKKSKIKLLSKPLLNIANIIGKPIILANVLFSAVINPALGASLEITTSPSINLPALVYIETENTESNVTPSKKTKHAQITSYLSTFKPQIQILPIGAEIEVINEDPIFHNTHVFDQGRTLFNVATPTSGISVQRKLTRTGLFNVRCDLHPFMNAWIAIVNSNYYTFIEKSGIYNINNIEPGRYKLHIHRSNRQEQIIALDFSSEEKKKIQLLPLQKKNN